MKTALRLAGKRKVAIFQKTEGAVVSEFRLKARRSWKALTGWSEMSEPSPARIEQGHTPATTHILSMSPRGDLSTLDHFPGDADRRPILHSGTQPTYRRRPELFFGMSSRPRTTSHMGVENKRQMRSRVRSVIGFPASIFCQ